MAAITSSVNEREELLYFRLQLREGLKLSSFEVSLEVFPQPRLADLTVARAFGGNLPKARELGVESFHPQ